MPNALVENTEPVQASRSQLIASALGFHAAGLFVAGAVSTLGTDRGFELFFGGIFGIFIGGIMSLPWFLASCVPLLAAPIFAAKRPVLLSTLLALGVSATWFVIFNDGRAHFMEWLAPVSASTSAILAIGATFVIRLTRGIAGRRSSRA